MFLSALVFLLSSLTAKADTILVTATRSETPTADLPYSTGVVEGESWEARGEAVEKALANIPGLAITAAGGPGQTRTVLIRGAKAEHTLVLIDGMPVNDPLSPSRSFDFSRIPVSEIERIEVIKGPQSVLYGSDAMGGVIHIITKKGARPPRLKLESGSYRTGKAKLSYLGFHADIEQSRGFSAADRYEENQEKDGYRAWRLGGKKEFPLGETASLQVQADYQESKVDTDSNGGRRSDSYHTATEGRQMLFRTDALWMALPDFDWNNSLSLSTHERDDNTAGISFFKAYQWKAESVGRKTLGARKSVIGLEAGQEAGRSNEITKLRRVQTGALYQFVYRLHGTLGARLDARSEQRLAPTMRAGAGYWILPNLLRVKSSVGTGFKAPSLYQTYSRYGREDLRPEKSLGADFGFELRSEDWDSEITGYSNRFREMIDFDSLTSRYYNLKAALTYGVEWTLARKFTSLTLRNSLTTLHSEDRATGLKLYRRPVVTDTIEAEYRAAGDRLGASSRLRYVGRRDDVHPTLFTRQSMPAFATIDADFFYRLGPQYKLTARADNLAGRRYQEISGYGVPGRSGYLGVEAQW